MFEKDPLKTIETFADLLDALFIMLNEVYASNRIELKDKAAILAKLGHSAAFVWKVAGEGSKSGKS